MQLVMQLVMQLAWQLLVMQLLSAHDATVASLQLSCNCSDLMVK